MHRFTKIILCFGMGAVAGVGLSSIRMSSPTGSAPQAKHPVHAIQLEDGTPSQIVTASADVELHGQQVVVTADSRLDRSPAAIAESNRDLFQRVAQALLVKAFLVDLAVDEETVTLRGSVADEIRREAIEKCVSGVSGVSRVENRLEIKSPEDTAASDAIGNAFGRAMGQLFGQITPPGSTVDDPDEVLSLGCEAFVRSTMLTLRSASATGAIIGGIWVPDAAWNAAGDFIVDLIPAAMFLFSGDGMPGFDEMDPETLAKYKDDFTPPIHATGLPEGMSLGACARWAHATYFDESGKQLPPMLEMRLQISCGKTVQISQTGMYWIEEFRDSNDKPLAIVERFFGENPFLSMVRVKRDEPFFGGTHPGDSVRIVLGLGNLEQPPGAIAEFRGSIRIQIPTKSKAIVIPNVASLAGKSIDHPELKKARLRLTISQDESDRKRFCMRVKAGDGRLIGDILPVDNRGEPAPPFGDHDHRLSLDFTQQVNWQVESAGLGPYSLPADMGLQVTLHSEFTEATIEFEFKDLEVPPPPVQRRVRSSAPPPAAAPPADETGRPPEPPQSRDAN